MQALHHPQPAARRSVAARAAALVLVVACASVHAVAVPQAGAAPGVVLADGGRSAAKVAPAAAAPRAVSETRPLWSELNGEQQQALQPLSRTWNTLSEAQKRKWIALSRNYRQMPAPEQAKLHSRMNDWVALSPQQRSQARLNFAETKDLSPDDKKAKWEAYQALSAEEKRKLAAGTARTPPTAAAVRPVPPQKLANVPSKSGRETKAPRIAAGPPEPLANQPVPAPVPLLPQ
jgi:hypothetical protein